MNLTLLKKSYIVGFVEINFWNVYGNAPLVSPFYIISVYKILKHSSRTMKRQWSNSCRVPYLDGFLCLPVSTLVLGRVNSRLMIGKLAWWHLRSYSCKTSCSASFILFSFLSINSHRCT